MSSYITMYPPENVIFVNIQNLEGLIAYALSMVFSVKQKPIQQDSSNGRGTGREARARRIQSTYQIYSQLLRPEEPKEIL